MRQAIFGKIVTYNQLAKELDELYQFYAKQSGLTESAFWTLYCVREREAPYTQKELCDSWSYSRQTINSALKQLERRGLVALQALPDNRKNKLLTLTPTGEELVKRIVDPLMEAEINAFAALGAACTEAFLQLTRRHVELLRVEIDKVLATR